METKNASTMSVDALTKYYAPPASQHWTRRAFHASIILNDTVFIDGGEMAIGAGPLSTPSSGGPPDYQLLPVNCSLTIPLTSDWNNTDVQLTAIPKPPMPHYNFQSLFFDSKRRRVNAYGGELSGLTSDPPDLMIWSYDPRSQRWTRTSTANDPPFSQGILRNFGGATTTSDGQFYALGGYTSPHTDPQTSNNQGFVPTPGLVSYDSSSSSWTNSSTVNGPSPLGTVEWAGLEAVPFGPNGLLAVIGGDTSDFSTYVPAQNRRDMSSITVYDPVVKRWFQQETTGTAPSQRSRFCTVGVGDATSIKGVNGTSGRGTYEIYMYGGWGGITGFSTGFAAKQYDEVWILTLPAFHWVLANANHTAPRIGHTCKIVGKGRSQLLSVGGQDISQTDPWSTPDDAKHPQGIGVFDLNALEWKDGYSVDAKRYKRPDIVEKVYQQSGSGGTPDKWTDPALEALVVRNVSEPLPAPPTTSINSVMPHHNSNSAKVGLGVGLSMGLLLLVGGIMYFLKRRQRKIAAADARATEERIREYQRNRYGQHQLQEVAGDFPIQHELYPAGKMMRHGTWGSGRAELGGDYGAAEKDAVSLPGSLAKQLPPTPLSSTGSTRTLVASPRSPKSKNVLQRTLTGEEHPALRRSAEGSTRERDVGAISPQSDTERSGRISEHDSMRERMEEGGVEYVSPMSSLGSLRSTRRIQEVEGF